jgi:hypothetical protein
MSSEPHSARRVVVTSIGLVSPVGIGTEETFSQWIRLSSAHTEGQRFQGLYRPHAAVSPIALSLRHTVVLPIPSNRAASSGLRFDLS